MYGKIVILKSSLDHLEYKLHLNLQHSLRFEDYFNGTIPGTHICIHNGILYSAGSFTVRAWNTETGQIIQNFRFNRVG